MALLGEKKKAVTAGLQAVALAPDSESLGNAQNQRFNLATIYSLTGETDQALDLMENILSRQIVYTFWHFDQNPAFKALKSVGRYQQLKQKYGQLVS